MPIIKLHRGSSNTMSNTNKKNIVLESGELFIEIPDNEVTEDNQYKFKVGDGITTYENLPYAIDPTNISNNNSSGNNEEEVSIDYIEKTDVTLSSNTTTTVTFTDDSIKSNSRVELVSNINNLEYTSVSISDGSCTFIFPIQSNTITVNFRLYVITEYYKTKKHPIGNATKADVLSGYTFSNASGIGLTGIGRLMPYRQLGETVICNLSGSHTKTNYQCDVVYVGLRNGVYQMCLLGNSYVNYANWTNACKYTWIATFAAGQVSDEAVTISNVKIPAKNDYKTCIGIGKRTTRFLNSRMWTSTSNDSSYSYVLGSVGGLGTYGTSNNLAVVPYITINL